MIHAPTERNKKMRIRRIQNQIQLESILTWLFALYAMTCGKNSKKLFKDTNKTHRNVKQNNNEIKYKEWGRTRGKNDDSEELLRNIFRKKWQKQFFFSNTAETNMAKSKQNKMNDSFKDRR